MASAYTDTGPLFVRLAGSFNRFLHLVRILISADSNANIVDYEQA